MATEAPAVVASPKAPTTPPPVESRSITLNVTDPELIAQIDAWQDGSAYVFEGTQTGPLAFDATAAYPAEEEVAEEAGEAMQMTSPVDKVIKAGAKKA